MVPRQTEAPSLEQAFCQFATGVVVVAGRNANDELIVARARAFNSLSLDPPLLLWSLDKVAGSFADFKAASGFVIHILAADQEPLLRNISASLPALAWPIQGGCSAWFACEQVSYLDGDDHGIFVGEIRDYAYNERRPLVRCAGSFVIPSPDTGAYEAQPQTDRLAAINERTT
jgi:3-hydroxy-9,10-secoandrosta-1,3,5(10)-triene-9,17-dione monooxygenase reductase component